MNPPEAHSVVTDTTSQRGMIDMRNSCQRWADLINAWTSWLTAAGASPGTIRTRRWYVRCLAETYITRSPWKLTTDDLTMFLAAHHWGPETLKSARSSLRSFYQWAATTGRTRHDPASLLPSVRVPRGMPRPAPDGVLRSALQVASDRNRLMLMLGAYAGLRAHEIAGLGVPDVRTALMLGALTVNGKGGRARRLPLHPLLAAELSAELKRRKAGSPGTGYRYRAGFDQWLFPGSRGGPITPGTVTRVLSRALGSYTAHQLRHRFASRAYDKRRDLRAVRELLGHADISTTVIYTALPHGALTAAVESVGLEEER